MAIFSKTLDENDLKQLTITGRSDAEPFPSAVSGRKMTVRDDQGWLWTFEYKVKSKNRVISGYHWQQFVAKNGVQAGHKVAFHDRESWYNADYRIEVIKTGS